MNKNRSRTVAAIPAYNEEKTIARTVLLAQRFVERVVVCDDGSTDMTAEIAQRLGATVIRHDTNRGYGAALQSLISKARELDADILVTLDGDGQHDPREIPVLAEPILEGKADIVIGSRFLDDVENKNNTPRYRRIGIKVITKLTDVASNYGLSDAQSGFRAYSRKALDTLSVREKGMGASAVILLEAKKEGLTVAEVPTRCNYHEIRTSTHGPLRHGTNVLMAIVRLVVEEKPLQFMGIPGVILLLLGIFFGVWLLQTYVAEHHIVTNIALASMGFTFIGLFAISTSITLYAMARTVQRRTN